MQKEKDTRLIGIYNAYLSVISPFIIQLETLDGEFPVEILNEIRSIFTHLARCFVTDKDSVYEENIAKAERHVKRAILDCFKYLCVAYDEYFRRFSKINRNVDLSFVDNGKFLHELNRLHIEAVNNKTFAQKKELTTENIEDVFDDYEKAYNSYASIYNLIQSSAKSIDFVKHKAVIKDRLNITFGIVGVVSLILTIIFKFI